METYHFKNFEELRAFLKEGRNFIEPPRVGEVKAEEEEKKDEVPSKRSNRRRAKRDVSEDSNE